MPTYPRIEVSVDVVALTGLEGVLHVLLVRRARAPYAGRWALPGGFLEVDEDLAPAAARELHVETGIALHPDELVQIGTYGAPHRDPRRRIVSVAHLAELDRDVDPQPGPDAEHAAWVAVRDVLGPEAEELAFDHAVILRDGVSSSRWAGAAAEWDAGAAQHDDWDQRGTTG
ncbi:ADP-ribose pyrophosphatase YjhB, NUDIX family [Nocardioides scoriae]|uniref:ADP-ribose pyrophosphatase YjhB, NUDIX family n=1 Tax=Nocardioides scoriae TaxID=642780 RepID=A0A1H1M808_9ACTN|nr:NUDIX hydrolase [Nocardioides scoriae]SDR82974.1 ADP-ribose pyrophosphatase YjhB, NUDIX family [Nocardioides scoriae]